MRRRVVVTGMGCVTPLGTTVPELWANLKAGRSGVNYTTLFDASNFPTRISAEVRDWSLTDVGEDEATWENRGRHTRFAVGAAKQAVDDAGVMGTIDADRFGVVDKDGTWLTPNQILALTLYHLKKNRGWTGAVVRTVPTSHQVDAVAQMLGVKVHETPVGFKYIGALMESVMSPAWNSMLPPTPIPPPITFPASRSLYCAGLPVYQANLCGEAFATARAICLPSNVSVICRAITTASGNSIILLVPLSFS